MVRARRDHRAQPPPRLLLGPNHDLELDPERDPDHHRNAINFSLSHHDPDLDYDADRDLDRHQNLTSLSLGHAHPSKN